MSLFNPNTLQLHARRAAKTFDAHAFLFNSIRHELEERVQGMQREFFTVLELSAPSFFANSFPMTLKEDSMDLVVSCLIAHWMNDLPGFLRHIRTALRAKGLFVGALWGGATLHELRESLLSAELELMGGASARVIPMLQAQDAPLLLSHAGFLNSVVDTSVLTVTYPSLMALMQDLRGMGETNKLIDRFKAFTPHRLFEKAEETYRSSFGLPDKTLPATFEVIYLTGWR